MNLARRRLLCAGAAIPLASCSVPQIRATSSLVQIPVAREALALYLTPLEQAAIGDSLAFLDGLYTASVRALDERPNLTLDQIVIATLGTPEQVRRIEAAYAAVYAAVLAHRDATGEIVPYVLREFDESVRPQYVAIRDAVVGRSGTEDAQAWLALLKPLAVLML